MTRQTKTHAQEVRLQMTQSEETTSDMFWLFHEEDEGELQELRKFIDPEIDTTPLEGIADLLYKLRHLLG